MKKTATKTFKVWRMIILNGKEIDLTMVNLRDLGLPDKIEYWGNKYKHTRQTDSGDVAKRGYWRGLEFVSTGILEFFRDEAEKSKAEPQPWPHLTPHFIQSYSGSVGYVFGGGDNGKWKIDEGHHCSIAPGDRLVFVKPRK